MLDRSHLRSYSVICRGIHWGVIGNGIPDISSMATCCASSFSFSVFRREMGVIPDVLAALDACVSVSALMLIIRGPSIVKVK